MPRENLPELYEPNPCRDLLMTHVAAVRRVEGVGTMVLCLRDTLVDVAEPTDVLRAKVKLYVPIARVLPNMVAVARGLGLTADLLAELRSDIAHGRN